MRLTKFTHACVRLDDGDRALVIDPGVWTEPEALDGVTDVLVTHEHYDHLNAELLAGAVKKGVRIHTHPDVAEQLGDLGDAVSPISAGENRTVGGFLVEAVGGEHAEIYEGKPGCANLGFLVDAPSGVVYHPGDSLHEPGVPVGTLLVPAAAPWLKLSEALDFVRAVRPHRAHPIHDAILSEPGQGLVDRWFDMAGRTVYSRIPVGGSVEV
ncbi:MBL fold metallo-hydrolase [Phytomonospora endophytica]|uniref:L-ascorbate metabolism protein UlaG (Beta-lactamase superfamily) n=1 Tax=Phytomonospora endophytica TaxID=714109 RepID=A0A841FF58_9ACTN|nr:MBL fold metallo-hydrolase [Phytomonospora endophytica]MBB6034474.1 L-ascorbate metabolism protein UlaG (beta-lactamase superfamily) [Phytomonospora endophytica]GIG70380.1 MBL fold metallo-hydrolase [Phytomonospora endophytica]